MTIESEGATCGYLPHLQTERGLRRRGSAWEHQMRIFLGLAVGLVGALTGSEQVMWSHDTLRL